MTRLMPWVTRVLIVTFALSSISCSTQYMEHSDETKPYKSENLKSEVIITKQSTPSEKETTVDYLLSKSSPVENYYHGTDTYKRSSLVGVGIMIASAAVAYYGYDSWKNARETIPPYYDPNPDYEAEKQAGQRIALIGIGGVLIGGSSSLYHKQRGDKKYGESKNLSHI